MHGCALYGEKSKLKVLGREFEEEPFFKRFFLNNCRKHSVCVPPLRGGRFYLVNTGKKGNRYTYGWNEEVYCEYRHILQKKERLKVSLFMYAF